MSRIQECREWDPSSQWRAPSTEFVKSEIQVWKIELFQFSLANPIFEILIEAIDMRSDSETKTPAVAVAGNFSFSCLLLLQKQFFLWEEPSKAHSKSSWSLTFWVLQTGICPQNTEGVFRYFILASPIWEDFRAIEYLNEWMNEWINQST
jgi:hypothetical protein